jgi:DNA-binding NtrC family response regulator
MRRAAFAGRVLRGMRVLWVDDNPENNANEVQLLQSFGVVVDQVTSTADALQGLSREKYDAVVSDVARGDDNEAGLRMINEMWERHLYRWTVLFVGQFDPSRGVPPRAFGITNRADHLLHYIIDIAERERF